MGCISFNTPHPLILEWKNHFRKSENLCTILCRFQISFIICSGFRSVLSWRNDAVLLYCVALAFAIYAALTHQAYTLSNSMINAFKRLVIAYSIAPQYIIVNVQMIFWPLTPFILPCIAFLRLAPYS